MWKPKYFHEMMTKRTSITSGRASETGPTSILSISVRPSQSRVASPAPAALRLLFTNPVGLRRRKKMMPVTTSEIT